MPVKYVTCNCVELGCNTKQFREGTQLHQGQKMCEAAFKKHAEEIKRYQSNLCVVANPLSPIGNSLRRSGQSLNFPNTSPTPRAQPSPSDSQQIVDTFKWSTISFSSVHRHALAVLIQTASGSLLEGRSEKDLNHTLKAEREKIKMSSQYSPSEINAILKQIPSTLQTTLRKLGLDPEVICSVCCPSCFALYPLPSQQKMKIKPAVKPSSESAFERSPPTLAAEISAPTPAVKPSAPTSPRTCSAIFFSQSKTYVNLLSKDEIVKCSEALFREDDKPHRIFTHHSLKSWLSRVLWRPQFEDLLDSALNRSPWSPDDRMHDVWDGLVWNTFQDPATPGTIYTLTSGNLVFSLYVDWFNPYQSNRKHASIGAVTLVCLNLPPWERYKEENIYIFGIIPGPVEPSLDEMNHILKPLVDEFIAFWKGVWFTKTFRHHNGRLIKAVIFPLIADLPALRKTAGFSGHAANFFCSFCMLSVKDINLINPQLFPPRVHEDHIAAAIEWKAAKTHSEREKIFNKHGVRYSILNLLPYWRPVEYCSIDLMHALLLGDIKDFCVNFLKLPEAGDLLKKQNEKRKNWALRNQSKDVFFILDQATVTEGISRPLKRSLEDDSKPEDIASGSKSPTALTAKRPKKSLDTTTSLDKSKSQSMQIRQLTKYNLRPRRAEIDSQITQQSLQLHDSNSGPLLSEKSSEGHKSQNVFPMSKSIPFKNCTSEASSYRPSSLRLQSNSPAASAQGSSSKRCSRFSRSTGDTPSDVEAPNIMVRDSPVETTEAPDKMVCDSPSDTSTEKGHPRTSAKNNPPSDASPKKQNCSSVAKGLNPPLENEESLSNIRTTKQKGKVSVKKRQPTQSKEDRNISAAEKKAHLAGEKKKRETLWPHLLPEELEAIHIAIENTEIPSTITRVPKLIGTSGNRTLKAAEWHVLFCVYFPLVLVPMWFFGHKNRDHEALLMSTASLIETTNLLSSRSISNSDGVKVQDLLIKYRTLLSNHWVGHETKPNLHISQHFPQVISRFGPPASTAAWAQERLNGILGKISTNNQLSNMNKTILTQWNMKSQFLSLIQGHGELFSKIPQPLMSIFRHAKSEIAGKEDNLQEDYYLKWVQHVRQSSHLESTAILNISKQVTLFDSIELDKKRYSILTKHAGNSTICCIDKSNNKVFGQIEQIFTSHEYTQRFFFVILPMKKIHSLPPEKDPYAAYPNLNAAFLSSSKDETVVFDDTQIRGHAIVLKNRPGTFGIATETCCAVGLTFAL